METVVGENCGLGLLFWEGHIVLCRSYSVSGVKRCWGGCSGSLWRQWSVWDLWFVGRLLRDPFPQRRVRAMWGKSSWGKHVWKGGAHCPLLVVPVCFLQGLSLLLQLLDPSLGFSHQLHVRIRRVAPGWLVSSHGPTCLTNIIITYPGPQQSSVHIDVWGNQLVSAQFQHWAIDKRGLGVTQHFIFKSCHHRMDVNKGKGERKEKKRQTRGELNTNAEDQPPLKSKHKKRGHITNLE